MKLLRYISSQYNSWISKSVNRRIFGSILTVSFFTAGVKLVNVFKEIFVAAQFGAGDEMDAYLIAFMFPAFGIGLISNSFNASLIPTYIRSREMDGPEATKKLFSGAMFFCVILLFCVSLIMAIALPDLLPYFALGFNEEKLLLTKKLFYVFLPLLVVSGFSTTWSAVINAGEKFFITAFAPVGRPLAIILPILLFKDHISIYNLSILTTFGYCIELVILGWRIRKQGLPLIPKWYGWSPPLKKIVSQYMPMIAGTFFMSSTRLVDQSMSAMLPAGSVSALNYGGKIVNLILELTATALGTAVIPHVSKMVAKKDIHGIINTFRTYQRYILLSSVPIILTVLFFSETIISIFFNRGAFGFDDVKIVSNIQVILIFQLPFYVLNVLTVRIVSSFRRNNILMYCAAFNAVINITLNYYFIKAMGVLGIALSTVCVHIFTYVFMLIMLNRILKNEKISNQMA